MEFPSEEPTEPEVVYEDEWLLIVHKPARMHTAPGLGSDDLCAWIFERYPDARLGSAKAGEPHSEGGLLHRLDYETSGLVLFARKSAAYASLLDQQAHGAFRKEYMAVSSPSLAGEPKGSSPVKGSPEGLDPGVWSEALEELDSEALSALIGGAVSQGCGRKGSCGIVSAFRSYGPKGARVACLAPAGTAAAAYRSDILACSCRIPDRHGAKSGPLELRLGLVRGFRHQLRAQLAWIGLPILGDPLYGGASDARLRLYAVRLAFTHPNSGNAFSVEL
jgi:23S rRNA pseudouridine1911/1915/1917 synthase